MCNNQKIEMKDLTSGEIRRLYDELYEKVLKIFDKRIKNFTNYDDTFEYQIDWIDRTDVGFEGSFYVKFKNQPNHSKTYQYVNLTLTFDTIDRWKNV